MGIRRRFPNLGYVPRATSRTGEKFQGMPRPRPLGLRFQQNSGPARCPTWPQVPTGGPVRPRWVCRAMNGINAIQDRDAGWLFCRCGLDATDELVPFLRSVRMSGTIQDAAHTQVDEDVIQFLGVESMGLVHVLALLHADHVEGQLGHLSRLVLEGQRAQHAVEKASFEDTSAVRVASEQPAVTRPKARQCCKGAIEGVMPLETKRKCTKYT